MMWLMSRNNFQGGPGASSLYGLFVENGPFIVNETGGVNIRQYRWTKQQSVIYIDNPAGTGFSFTDPEGIPTEQTQIGNELYEALQQFFKLFPEFQKNQFFLTGKCILHFHMYIHYRYKFVHTNIFLLKIVRTGVFKIVRETLCG